MQSVLNSSEARHNRKHYDWTSLAAACISAIVAGVLGILILSICLLAMEAKQWFALWILAPLLLLPARLFNAAMRL